MIDKKIRCDPDFEKELKDIKIQRIKRGINKEMKSDRRLTKAIRRHNLFQDIKRDIIMADLKEDKRGNKRGSVITDMIILIAVVVVALVLFVAWSYAHNILTSDLITFGSTADTNMINVTSATQSTFSPVNSSMPILQWLVLGMFVAMIIAMFISNFLIKVHPVFFVIYILITIIVIIFSAYISNAYESFSTGNALESTFQSWSAMNYIMLHLPIIMTMVGFIGGILLFINITRDKEMGGIY